MASFTTTTTTPPSLYNLRPNPTHPNSSPSTPPSLRSHPSASKHQRQTPSLPLRLTTVPINHSQHIEQERPQRQSQMPQPKASHPARPPLARVPLRRTQRLALLLPQVPPPRRSQMPILRPYLHLIKQPPRRPHCRRRRPRGSRRCRLPRLHAIPTQIASPMKSTPYSHDSYRSCSAFTTLAGTIPTIHLVQLPFRCSPRLSPFQATPTSSRRRHSSTSASPSCSPSATLP